MAEEQKWKRSFDNAVEVIRRGDFDEVKAAMEVLGFATFREVSLKRRRRQPSHFLLQAVDGFHGLD